MNNCYCGHPKERHVAWHEPLAEEPTYKCRHCACTDYAESQEPKPCDHGNGICNPKNFPCNQFTQEPKALEVKCPNLGKFNCICSQCYKEAKPQEAYGFRDHRHCQEKDSPCGMKGKHPCCLCGTEPQEEPKVAKPEDMPGYLPSTLDGVEPQEEPKKCCDNCQDWLDGVNSGVCAEGGDCPCHKKETEPKEAHYCNIGILAGVPLYSYGSEEMAQAAADKLKKLLIKSQE